MGPEGYLQIIYFFQAMKISQTNIASVVRSIERFYAFVCFISIVFGFGWGGGGYKDRILSLFVFLECCILCEIGLFTIK